MRVPLLDVKAQLEPLHGELMAAIEEVVRSGMFIMGEKVSAIEAEIAAYTGARHAIGVSSGTDALLLALMALDVGPGHRVITSTLSFFATAGVISRLNAQPVFVDIEPDGFNLDTTALRATLEGMAPEERASVKAIIPVHLFGQCADMDGIGEIAAEHGIPLIEDAAQAIGAEYPGRDGVRQAGTLGAMGCFSFFPSKNLGAFGDGGMVVTDDDALAEVLRIKRVHGGRTQYAHDVIGGNFRLDALQAAVLSVKLPHLNGWHDARRANAARYTAAFGGAGLTDVRPPPEIYLGSACARPHIFNQYTLRAARRDDLRAHLSERGVASQVYYPIPFHRQPCFADLGYRPEQFPQAERAAAEVLSLPIYGELTDEMLDYVAAQVADFYA